MAIVTSRRWENIMHKKSLQFNCLTRKKMFRCRTQQLYSTVSKRSCLLLTLYSGDSVNINLILARRYLFHYILARKFLLKLWDGMKIINLMG
ncbi:hypothetical protein ARMGADRAFT_358357 [Armillaria gallica]|uniref:Uncharacterized protein n=1 Tax=Armillaria gallica TaxID=47427 RepID=A0A2H3CZP1_ARMGA|nr:hypothetical protein ARMGADRAFT_358357 [Armillaria gallica]